MIAAHSISRLAGVFVIATQEYVRTNGKSKPLATKLNGLELSIAIGFGLLPLLLLTWQTAVCGLLAVFVIWCWFSLKLKKRLGGYTGDCLGAMQQLTEIAFYLSVLAWSSHSWKFI
jgi:adenosylcobinamide-GDP ribazoletransferase